MFAEASRSAASVDGLAHAVRLLNCAIKYEQDDLAGCRKALEAFSPSDPIATVNLGCVLFKEAQYAEALEQFGEATQMMGYTPELAYALAACHYRLRDFASALKVVAEIIELGVREHPELGIGSQSEGVEVRSVGNSAKLKQTALVEAFNLKAAIELEMQDPAAAAASLSDMPPRREQELDPVTLHNQAVVSIAQGGAGAEAAGLDKLHHLLDHPPFPGALLSNLLSLVCRPGSSMPELAERVLQDCAADVARHVPKDLRPLYEACAAAKSQSPAEARVKLDVLAGQHIESLRKLVKRVQDARWANDQAAAAAGMAEYEQAVDSYIPVLMMLGSIEWEAGAFTRAQEVLQQSAEFCSDHPTWRLNLAHTILAQEGKVQDAIDLYESILQHYLGTAGEGAAAAQGNIVSMGSSGEEGPKGSLMDVPPAALANLCVCYVISSQNEVAEDLLKRVEEETTAAQAAGQSLTQHLSLTNLAIGTLYCSKGNFEFGIGRVMRSLEPLSANLDSQRWQGAKLCLLAMLDQMSKQMLVPKDAMVADLLTFLEDVEGAGKTLPARVVIRAEGEASPTVCMEARALRCMLLKMTD
ncbi:hypothetical protein N2152v2_007225 [Parachlorella kessleri]